MPELALRVLGLASLIPKLVSAVPRLPMLALALVSFELVFVPSAPRDALLVWGAVVLLLALLLALA